MARDVKIQVLDVVSASGSKQIYANEPMVIRSQNVIEQVTGVTKPTSRLAISKADKLTTDDNDLKGSILQYPTVNELNEALSASQDGYIEKTVQYGLIIYFSAAPSSTVVAGTFPASTVFQTGDLALATYTGQTWFPLPIEYFKSDGNDLVYPSDESPIYRYDGTKWVPYAFDNAIGTDKKYKVKDGKLGDIAPTLLKVMGVEIPKEMTGNILVE